LIDYGFKIHTGKCQKINKKKENIIMYYIYFRGTRNGETISANNMNSAKWIFAKKHNLVSLSYIAGKKVK
jgi:hypothetical protein